MRRLEYERECWRIFRKLISVGDMAIIYSRVLYKFPSCRCLGIFCVFLPREMLIAHYSQLVISIIEYMQTCCFLLAL